MANVSAAFNLYDVRIQRRIWDKGWGALREIQELAAAPVHGGILDVIVAAPTASGKTEAAFFPALSRLASAPEPGLIVYVSPLKALINDQVSRLQPLCHELDLLVWPWHGDVSASIKTRFQARPCGVLLITPESLEALLCTKGSRLEALFKGTQHIVIDELHAFIGSERGKQLQSQLARIDVAVGRKIPRIGLSATLGDMHLASEFLRPGKGARVVLVESSQTGAGLKILVKGYEEAVSFSKAGSQGSSEQKGAAEQIAQHLFKALQGTSNLIFPNSRREVERYTHLLGDLCERNGIPQEFWPHHGNLSKEIRSDTESALKQSDIPATAVCTNTLELGVDIGDVKSVAQIGPPPAVASLRQRLGRSGRRPGEFSVLRGYTTELALGGPNVALQDRLRLGTVQLVAMVELLLAKWCEPPRAGEAHYSTLIQQVLSLIAQKGGMTAPKLFLELCGPTGAFPGVSPADFSELLRGLGNKDLITQESGGVLLHGKVGERLVNHYSFFAAFNAEEEFRIVSGGKPLGTVPVSHALSIGQRIIFAGKAWRVDDVDEKQKTVHVTHKAGGAPPMFTNAGGRVHTRVRQAMFALLGEAAVPSYLDHVAQRFLREARLCFKQAGLAHTVVWATGDATLVCTWLGDAANEALARMLRLRGLATSAEGPFIEVMGEGVSATWEALEYLADNPPPCLEALLGEAKNLETEKWDWALPPQLLRRSYASHNLDLNEATAWCVATVAAKRILAASSSP